jgi:putative endonuclease
MRSTATKVMARVHTSRSSRPTGPAQFTANHLRLSLKRLFNFFKRQAPASPAHLDLGKRGEKLAADYLRRNAYKILYRNFKPKRGGGEIDLVCRDMAENALVFVEVKSRTTDAFGPPHFAVTRKKRELIIRGAKEWLRMLDDPRAPYRFDIVEVLMEDPPRITLLRSAFETRDDIYS